MNIFQFNVVNTQIISGQFSTKTGETITVDWGDDGATSNFSGVNQAYSKDYGSPGNRTVTITAIDESCLTKFSIPQTGANVQFDIQYLPSGLTYFLCAGGNTVSGDIQYLPSGLTYFNCYGLNTVSGDIQYLPSGLTYFICYGSNTVSGDIQYLPSGLTYFNCAGNNTVSGDIQYLPSGLTYFNCAGNNTVSNYSGKTWTTKPSTFKLAPASGGLSTAEIDQLLIDFNDDLVWASGNVIELTGTNAPRSAVSNDAVTSIEGELATVTTSSTLQFGNLYKITATETDHFGTGLGIGDYFTSNGTETVNANNKVKQVLTPSSNGVTIVSTQGGTTYDWASVESGFDWNDLATYEIFEATGEITDSYDTVTVSELKDAVDVSHTQNTDTALGTMAADINMDSSYQITNLQAPAAAGEAIRQTATVTEDSLELVVATKALDVRDFVHDDGSGSNNVISTMAFIPKFVTSGWPQAALNGLEVGGFWIDVYKNSHPAATSTARGTASPDSPGTTASTSRPGVSLWDDISWTSARIAASNRTINGRACHLVTPFERFAVMSWIMQSGNWGNVRGNNDYGKDTRDSATWGNYGIFDPLQAEYRTLTGSGPASWWSGGVIGQGIHGLVANVYEWEDLRLEAGIFQPKAYLAGAATAADTYIDYDDNAGGDGTNICQLTPGIYTITDAVNGNEDVTVERVIITGRFTGRLILSAGLGSNHGDNCLIQLKTAVDLCQDGAVSYKAVGALLEDATSKYMALPDYADTSTHYSTLLDSWYAYDSGDSRVLLRCGSWGDATYARSGLVVATNGTPTNASYSIGFRSALSIGNL